jgi:hypothetical protein
MAKVVPSSQIRTGLAGVVPKCQFRKSFDKDSGIHNSPKRKRGSCRWTRSLAIIELSRFRNREAMAAHSRGRKPTGTKRKTSFSREAATGHSAQSIAAAASRLTTFLVSISAGLRPQLRAAATSWLKPATSILLFRANKTGSELLDQSSRCKINDSCFPRLLKCPIAGPGQSFCREVNP